MISLCHVVLFDSIVTEPARLRAVRPPIARPRVRRTVDRARALLQHHQQKAIDNNDTMHNNNSNTNNNNSNADHNKTNSNNSELIQLPKQHHRQSPEEVHPIRIAIICCAI